jgi:hypothetical protein
MELVLARGEFLTGMHKGGFIRTVNGFDLIQYLSCLAPSEPGHSDVLVRHPMGSQAL